METASSNVPKVCETCGSTIFADSPRGLCSICLFRTGLGSEGDESADSSSAPMFDFGDYELLAEIGRGGQAVVYRARQKSLNRTVALKVIGLGKWSSTPHLRRFRQEAEAAASLEHPRIVPIYEIGESNGSCYFSMKFIEGGQLDEVIKREPISPRRAAELLVKIARTVQFAHDHGILHRDIKPGNILLDGQAEPHLTDFGLARLVENQSTVTNSFDVLGTPSYMAPEQAAGRTKGLTAAADVYSLGAVFYQTLTGQPPFAGGTTYDTIRMVIESEPRSPRLWNPKVDVDLATVCLKCLEKDPQRRYASAKTLAEDLEHWLRHEPIVARRTGMFSRGWKWMRRNPTTAALIPSLAAVAVLALVMFWQQTRNVPATGIAVLPFENLSEEKEAAFLADGLQDDILTKLGKIAELKVISRASVMSYRGERNLRQISAALGVSHLLEGTVRRVGKKVHVNTQLVDTRSDTGVWAEEYDRDLKDVFAIESEVAQSIASQFRAKVSARERVAISEWPTKDLVAYDFYVRGKNLFEDAAARGNGKEDLLGAVDLLNQAVARDADFFQAYCQLVFVNDLLYNLGHDHTPGRLALANASIEAASRLKSETGEAHLARADNLYRCYGNFDAALGELALARQTLPNNPQLFELTAQIERRQGKFDEALQNMQRATELDPRNIATLQQLAINYSRLARYPQKIVVLDRILAIDPDQIEAQIDRAGVEFMWKANVQPLHQVLDSIRAKNPDALNRIANVALDCALLERDYVAAKRVLDTLGERPAFIDGPVRLSRKFGEGFIAHLSGAEADAHAAFIAARAEQEKIVQADPNYGPPWCALGLIDAMLGRKGDALREGRRAVELLPVTKDATNGPAMIGWLAEIAAWAGEKDLACEQLELSNRYPGTGSYGDMKLDPFWDPMRGYPCFEKILSSLAPKETHETL